MGDDDDDDDEWDAGEVYKGGLVAVVCEISFFVVGIFGGCQTSGFLCVVLAKRFLHIAAYRELFSAPCILRSSTVLCNL